MARGIATRLPGDAAARKIAARVETRRKQLGLKEEHVVLLLGLKSASGWTKRIEQGDGEWVPFRLNELTTLRPVMAPHEPDWPFVETKRAEPTPPTVERGDGDFT